MVLDFDTPPHTTYASHGVVGINRFIVIFIISILN